MDLETELLDFAGELGQLLALILEPGEESGHAVMVGLRVPRHYFIALLTAFPYLLTPILMLSKLVSSVLPVTVLTTTRNRLLSAPPLVLLDLAAEDHFATEGTLHLDVVELLLEAGQLGLKHDLPTSRVFNRPKATAFLMRSERFYRHLALATQHLILADESQFL